MASKENFIKGGEAFLYIKDKSDKIRPWVCNNTQHMLLNAYFDAKAENRPVREVVLKGRQQGCSTGVGAIGFMHMVTHLGANLLIAANEKQSSARNIFNMYRLYKNMFPIDLPTKHEVSGELIEFDEQMNFGSISVSGESKVVSFTYKFIHLSEAAKFNDLDEFMDEMLETVPMHLVDTSIFVESTAEAYGDQFHELWQMAEAGQDDNVGWHPLFIPWFVHEEYEYPFASQQERDEFEASLNDTEEARFGDEKALLNLPPINIPIKPGETRKVGVTLENLKWRRDKLAVMKFSLPRFCRQYPSTPDEAFLTAMVSPLDRKSLDWYTRERVHDKETGEKREPVRAGEFFEQDEVSNIFEFRSVPHPIVRKYEEVHPYRKYIVGIDLAQGMESGDFSTAIVICRLPFRVVAVLRGMDGRRLDPHEFARQVYALGQYYNNAMLCPENNKDGGGVIRSLLNWRYPNIVKESLITGNSAVNRYGWMNNGQTHKRMVAELQRVIRERSIDIPDEDLIEELKHLVYRPGTSGGVQAAKKGQKRRPGSLPTGYYDDLAFAFGGALVLESVLEPPKNEKRIEQEQRFEARRERHARRQRETFDENSWLDIA